MNKRKSLIEILEYNMKDILLAKNINIFDFRDYQFKEDVEWVVDYKQAEKMLNNIRNTQNLLENMNSKLKDKFYLLLKKEVSI
ncbi:hypothetical protein [Candidatus Pelagibacter sp. HIMB1746]|uniref:hypothetical protein n=1 Tax=Candidatus Pelagibacter sp. HIMB1746 TaxID=3413370 RepID=UPI003F87CF44